VRGIRSIERALGDGIKRPQASEQKNMPIARKSLVAAVAIKRGEPFTAQNVTAKRPANGLSPMTYWALLGRRAQRDYERDEPLDAAGDPSARD
jgi:sialic acid synthase SpsE